MILVISIVSLAALPGLDGLLRDDAYSTARELAGIYREARDEATTGMRPVTVALDVRTGRWRLRARALPGRDAVVRRGRLPEDTSLRISRRSGHTATVTFSPFGRANADAVLVGGRADRHEVVVDRWTSAIEIRER